MSPLAVAVWRYSSSGVVGGCCAPVDLLLLVVPVFSPLRCSFVALPQILREENLVHCCHCLFSFVSSLLVSHLVTNESPVRVIVNCQCVNWYCHCVCCMLVVYGV